MPCHCAAATWLFGRVRNGGCWLPRHPGAGGWSKLEQRAATRPSARQNPPSEFPERFCLSCSSRDADSHSPRICSRDSRVPGFAQKISASCLRASRDSPRAQAGAMADPSFSYDDRFTPSKSRKKRRHRPPHEQPAPAVLLARTSAELAASDWLPESTRHLRDALAHLYAGPDPELPPERPPGCMCLGLGSPAVSRDARAQLAFLLAACDALSLDRSAVPVFDPVFSDEDRALLTELGLQPTAEDRQARYALDAPTIAFMPHCDLQLYENLLRANWTRTALPRVVLIANRLSEYADSMPARKLSAEYPCVARIAPHLTAHALPPWAAQPTAFNSTSVQYVRADALARLPDDWWALPALAPEPDGT
ncbi:hypothetical protein OBBRIDRAFT_788168 [Obba rivulosa]|uniref:SRR1-like domain-containing protein n=1 Tax=Obba rivulosa TaxID=1052685 RepID=A0A8E2DTM4_9APHY|nr:hypothetical protein OBBRIDRAFT_788168 [Obba rivulosa]